MWIQRSRRGKICVEVRSSRFPTSSRFPDLSVWKIHWLQLQETKKHIYMSQFKRVTMIHIERAWQNLISRAVKHFFETKLTYLEILQSVQILQTRKVCLLHFADMSTTSIRCILLLIILYYFWNSTKYSRESLATTPAYVGHLQIIAVNVQFLDILIDFFEVLFSDLLMKSFFILLLVVRALELLCHPMDGMDGIQAWMLAMDPLGRLRENFGTSQQRLPNHSVDSK